MNLTVTIEIEDTFYEDLGRMKKEYAEIKQKVDDFNARNTMVKIKPLETEGIAESLTNYARIKA